MPALPIQLNAAAASGSQWSQVYQLLNEDGTLMAITNKTFELVIRPAVTDATIPPLVAVNSTASTTQGAITVNTGTSTITVVVSPTATALLGQGARPYTLWMDQGLSDATAVVAGTFFTNLIAAA